MTILAINDLIDITREAMDRECDIMVERIKESGWTLGRMEQAQRLERYRSYLAGLEWALDYSAKERGDLK